MVPSQPEGPLRCFILTSALLYGCAADVDKDAGDTDASTDTPVPVDLVSDLGPNDVRAGVITQPESLFTGVFAEGQLGDVMLKNDRVTFIVQSAREGSYIVGRGGGVLDADIVRPDGQFGRDPIKDWVPNAGIGRVVNPDVVEVADNGIDSGIAVVRVEGPESPIRFLEGTIEAQGLIADLGLRIEHTYTLEPGSYLLRVDTTISSPLREVSLPPGDLLMGAPEVAWSWEEGSGLSDEGRGGAFKWTSYVGHAHDVTVAVLAADGGTLAAGALDIVSSAADVLVAFGETVDITPETPYTHSRWYGVGPDLASLTDEILTRESAPVDTLTGTVAADDGPVAGAWVGVEVDGAPYTLAVTGADGTWSADVPEGSTTQTIAVGTQNRRFMDLPDGATSYPPYGSPQAQQDALTSLSTGGTPVARSEGRGVGTDEAPLTLGTPATLRVTSARQLPFFIRAQRTDAAIAEDERWVPRKPGGADGLGWSIDDSIDLSLPAGTYAITAHRGMRFDAVQETVTLVAGMVETLEIDLTPVELPEGWWLVDPHAHGPTSGDADISMEDRVIVAAANGIQAHFGTDHDRTADYRPLLGALGLDGLRSVVANEFSPSLRGHFNIYPITPDPLLPNAGSWAWWNELPETSDEMLAFLEGRQSTPLIIQSNHPTDSGVAASAGWAMGVISNADRWTERLDVIEVMNSADYEEFLAFYLDLFLRGVITAPVGVSDSHGHLAGNIGMSATYLQVPGTSVDVLTDANLVDAMQERRTVVTRGPFISSDPMPGSVVTASTTTLSAEAFCAPWCTVDRLVLYRDGEAVETVEGTTATFDIDDAEDAAYYVIAEGDNSMQPVSSHTPWAMTSPILRDVDDDGWDPPLPPLVVR